MWPPTYTSIPPKSVAQNRESDSRPPIKASFVCFWKRKIERRSTLTAGFYPATQCPCPPWRRYHARAHIHLSSLYQLQCWWRMRRDRHPQGEIWRQSSRPVFCRSELWIQDVQHPRQTVLSAYRYIVIQNEKSGDSGPLHDYFIGKKKHGSGASSLPTCMLPRIVSYFHYFSSRGSNGTKIESWRFGHDFCLSLSPMLAQISVFLSSKKIKYWHNTASTANHRPSLARTRDGLLFTTTCPPTLPPLNARFEGPHDEEGISPFSMGYKDHSIFFFY